MPPKSWKLFFLLESGQCTRFGAPFECRKRPKGYLPTRGQRDGGVEQRFGRDFKCALQHGNNAVGASAFIVAGDVPLGHKQAHLGGDIVEGHAQICESIFVQLILDRQQVEF